MSYMRQHILRYMILDEVYDTMRYMNLYEENEFLISIYDAI